MGAGFPRLNETQEALQEWDDGIQKDCTAQREITCICKPRTGISRLLMYLLELAEGDIGKDRRSTVKDLECLAERLSL